MPASPRIPLLTDDELSEEQRELTKHYRRNGELPNVFRLGLRNLNLFKAYKPFGLYLMALSKVPPRIREIAILRTAFLSRSDYEWGHHVRLGLEDAGLSYAEIERVKLGAGADGWEVVDAATLRLVDQIHASSDVDDATFDILFNALGEDVVVELINTIGNYFLVGSMLNIFRVPLEEGVPGIDTPLG